MFSGVAALEDYLHFVKNLLETTPDLILLSSAFLNALQIAITTTTLLSAAVSHDGLDTVRLIVGHDSLRGSATQPPPLSSSAPNDPRESDKGAEYANVIRSTFGQPDVGGRFVYILLSRLVTDFHEDCAPMSVTLGRILAEQFPQEMAQWVPSAIALIPKKDLREPERHKFLLSFEEGIRTGNLGKVRNAWNQLDRASRKERERLVMRSGA